MKKIKLTETSAYKALKLAYHSLRMYSDEVIRILGHYEHETLHDDKSVNEFYQAINGYTGIKRAVAVVDKACLEAALVITKVSFNCGNSEKIQKDVKDLVSPFVAAFNYLDEQSGKWFLPVFPADCKLILAHAEEIIEQVISESKETGMPDHSATVDVKVMEESVKEGLIEPEVDLELEPDQSTVSSDMDEEADDIEYELETDDDVIPNIAYDEPEKPEAKQQDKCCGCQNCTCHKHPSYDKTEDEKILENIVNFDYNITPSWTDTFNEVFNSFKDKFNTYKEKASKLTEQQEDINKGITSVYFSSVKEDGQDAKTELYVNGKKLI